MYPFLAEWFDKTRCFINNNASSPPVNLAKWAIQIHGD